MNHNYAGNCDYLYDVNTADTIQLTLSSESRFVKKTIKNVPPALLPQYPTSQDIHRPLQGSNPRLSGMELGPLKTIPKSAFKNARAQNIPE